MGNHEHYHGDFAESYKLLKDKLGSADWDKHAGNSSSWFVNAATWSLMLTGNIYREDETEGNPYGMS
jgi:RHH-type proline utilization regulon transcriptional repressor/proline dehydrogenase/delta 1-pyrroline-5-carboxylate dehydrogenase